MTKFLKIPVIAGLVIYMCFVLTKATLTDKTNRDSQIHSKIIKVEEGYGYQILIGEKLLVQQKYIPAVNGEVAFKTPNDAKKVADLVKDKLLNRSSPEVTVEELTNLNILTLKH
ncbi:DUF4907 domain-containing protein [Flagellimonas sp. 2504JD4-2]